MREPRALGREHRTVLLPLASLAGPGLLAIALSGCTSVAYVTQAAVGQENLMMRARDIDELVRDERVDGRMRGLLSEVPAIKHFGERHGLRATTNYTKYARVDGPAIVWVVSASEPLRFQSKQWSFPLVGSFTYLGWFARKDADVFAAGLRKEGWDVDVRGSGAYSTTGYFEDPVLSTMIAPGEEALGELANVILHESAHATIFVHNQSTLNESVAEFVGDGLAEVYLDETRGAESDEAEAYRDEEAHSAKRKAQMRHAYLELESVYAGFQSDADKLSAKAENIRRLTKTVHARRPLNNAALIQYRTYNSGQEEMRSLLAACGGDWGRFVRTMKRLEGRTFPHEQEADVGKLVAPLVGEGCGK
jgi:predicted aminopeptidase